MKLELALIELRFGKKIWHPGMADNEYYMACRISIRPDISKPIRIDEMPMSIVWMRGDRQHPDMKPFWNPYDKNTDPCKHGLSPMINLLWLMSEQWVVIDDETKCQ